MKIGQGLVPIPMSDKENGDVNFPTASPTKPENEGGLTHQLPRAPPDDPILVFCAALSTVLSFCL